MVCTFVPQPPVLITAALPFECHPLVALLAEATRDTTASGRWHGHVDGTAVVIQETGMGLHAADEAARGALEQVRPRCVIASGLAGGIAPAVGLGDAIVPDCVAREGGPDLIVDHELRAAAAMHLPERRSRRGRLVSVDRVVRLPSEKASLAAETRADAVDMESASILEQASQRSIPAVVIRAASDTAEDELPDLSGLDLTLRGDQLRLVGRALTSPRTALGVVRLARGGQRAMQTVTAILENLLPCLKL